MMNHYLDREIQEGTEEYSVPIFTVDTYNMQFDLDRTMQANVEIVPTQKDLSTYEFTLYHLYQIDSVKNSEGIALPYDRTDDYLTVYSDQEVESIVISYHGEDENLYATKHQMNLPGDFPYYPMPGRLALYSDYEMQEQRLEQPAHFLVELNTDCEVYSNLQQNDSRALEGNSKGPIFLLGYLREGCENGVQYVYPYISEVYNPNSEYVSEDYRYVINELDKLGIEHVIFLPGLYGREKLIIEGNQAFEYGGDWSSLANRLRDGIDTVDVED